MKGQEEEMRLRGLESAEPLHTSLAPLPRHTTIHTWLGFLRMRLSVLKPANITPEPRGFAVPGGIKSESVQYYWLSRDIPVNKDF